MCIVGLFTVSASGPQTPCCYYGCSVLSSYYSTFPLQFAFLRGNKSRRLETLTQCTECSQFAFQHFFENLATVKNCRVFQDFSLIPHLREILYHLAANAATATVYLRHGWCKARRPAVCLAAVNGQHAVSNAHSVFSWENIQYSFVCVMSDAYTSVRLTTTRWRIRTQPASHTDSSMLSGWLHWSWRWLLNCIIVLHMFHTASKEHELNGKMHIMWQKWLLKKDNKTMHMCWNERKKYIYTQKD